MVRTSKAQVRVEACCPKCGTHLRLREDMVTLIDTSSLPRERYDPEVDEREAGKGGDEA